MQKTIYENLCEGRDTRKNLIALKECLKKDGQKEEFLEQLGYDFTLLRKLLEQEDPKIRKNTAQIIGELELDGMAADLFEAYEEEETLFVKSTYLKALRKLSCEMFLPKLQEHFEELLKRKGSAEEEKHITEEIRELAALLDQYGKQKRHRFIGYDEPGKVVLTTNRLHPEVTLRQLPKEASRKMIGGVSLNFKDIRDFQNIRTYNEILFPIPSAKNLNAEPKSIAHALILGGIVKFLDARHLGDSPYKFRVEMRTRMSPDARGEFVKKMAATLEQESGHCLVNSTSGYEVEIRLMETKTGTFNVYLKLYTISDHRFDYRKKTLASSINPVTAATVMELARPYLKEGAQVLDPFCGTGTMLIERHFIMPAHPLYGLDIYGTAIDYARENTSAANVLVNYIQRDFEAFSHDYLFDEIVTNMPAVVGQKTTAQIHDIYHMFFEKTCDVLKDGGIILMYSSDPQIALEHIKRQQNIILLEQYPIYQKDRSCLYILKKINN